MQCQRRIVERTPYLILSLEQISVVFARRNRTRGVVDSILPGVSPRLEDVPGRKEKCKIIERNRS